jgi:REP element-mobilizing transposase RayT
LPVKPDFNPDYLYFTTANAVNHSYLFERDIIKQILVDSLNHLRTNGRMKLFAFVIMPSHSHLIARFSGEHLLSVVMRDFKKFTARAIYNQFLAEGDAKTLAYLRKAGRAVKQEYKVWEDGYDARDVFSIKFLRQKVEYIHHNPCQPQWKLVDKPEDYLWSTAGFYLADKSCIITVDDVREYLHAPSGLRPEGSE